MSRPGAAGRRADAVRNRKLALQAATDLLAARDLPLTVEAIARRAGLGVGTVVRAFGGKDALLDAAVSCLLSPIVERAEALRGQPDPEQALRTFLVELIVFQSAHYAVADVLGGVEMPMTTQLRARLVHAVEQMIDDAATAGTIRTDIPPALVSELVTRTMHTIARSQSASTEFAAAFVTVLMDGLQPPS